MAKQRIASGTGHATLKLRGDRIPPKLRKAIREMDGRELESMLASIEKQAKAVLSTTKAPEAVSAALTSLKKVRFAREQGVWESAVLNMYNVGWSAARVGMGRYETTGKQVTEGGGKSHIHGTTAEVKARHSEWQKEIDKRNGITKGSLSWNALAQQVARVVWTETHYKNGKTERRHPSFNSIKKYCKNPNPRK